MSRADWIANRRIIDNSITPIVQTTVSGIPDDSGQNRVFSLSGVSISPNTGHYCSVETKLFLSGSTYENVGHNNAISMRAKLKAGGAPVNTGSPADPYGWGIGLSAYSPQITTETTTNMTSPLLGGGYSLELIRKVVSWEYNPDIMQNLLVIKARSSLISGTESRDNNLGVGQDTVVTCSGTYLSDTWYDVRFDLIPTSLTTKVLTAYTSDDNGATWNVVGTYTVNTSMTTRWRSDGFVGFNSTVVWDGAIPYSPSPGQEAKCYIGNFKINIDPINFNP